MRAKRSPGPNRGDYVQIPASRQHGIAKHRDIASSVRSCESTADRTVAVSGSEQMVDALRELGAEVTFIKVPGGGHSDIAPPNMARIFDFFDAHRRSDG